MEVDVEMNTIKRAETMDEAGVRAEDEAVTDRNQLIIKYEYLVYAVLHEVSDLAFNRGYKDEFICLGYEKLMDAAMFYNPKAGSFASYAYTCIRNAYMTEARAILDRENRLECIDQQVYYDIDGGYTLVDILSDGKEPEEDRWIDRITADELMDIAKSCLSAKELNVLMSYIYIGSMSEVANNLGVSKQRIHQIMNDCREKIKFVYNNGVKIA